MTLKLLFFTRFLFKFYSNFLFVVYCFTNFVLCFVCFAQRGEKYDKILRKYESKLAECKDRHNEHKAEKLREKIEGMVERKKERIALQEETKVNFDLNGKSIVFKVEDAPVRVLNQLAALGYSVMPSAGGSGSSGHGHGHGNFVWTLFKPGYVPTPIYPELNLSSTD